MRQHVVMATVLLSLALSIASFWHIRPVASTPLTAPRPRGGLITAFREDVPITYQGQLRLNQGNMATAPPINGDCSFSFGLFDAEEGGVRFGRLVTVTTTVQNGLFTVQLDFGDVSTEKTLWLDTAVKCGEDGEYITVKPRHRLTPSPAAVSAQSLPGLWTEYDPLLVLETQTPNIIGGALNNVVADTVKGGTVLGGGGPSNDDTIRNKVDADYGSVVGGQGNSVLAGALYSFVAGGQQNKVSGEAAIVAGGKRNEARGATSFAAGQQAIAIDRGAFVWADSTARPLKTSGDNQFIVRAHGGIWLGKATDKQGNPVDEAPAFSANNVISTSHGAILDSNGFWRPAMITAAQTTKVAAVNRQDILQRVMRLPVQSWTLKTDPTATRHIGIYDADFATIFEVGKTDESKVPLDVEGVTLAAVQGLYAMVVEREHELAQVSERVTTLQVENESLRTELKHMHARLTALEARTQTSSPQTDTSLPASVSVWGAILAGLMVSLALWQRGGRR